MARLRGKWFLFPRLNGSSKGAPVTGKGESARGHDGAAGRSPERPGFDTSVAHQARMYDYWLGGKDNFAADRKAAEESGTPTAPQAQALEFFTGLGMVDPGVVELRRWRPSIESTRVTPGWCGLGRKP
jgi:hypothetical protein